MSDEGLFRWNFSLQLECEKCQGAVFAEDVKTGEIFCSTCGKTSHYTPYFAQQVTYHIGHVLASNETEWPEGWDAEASYGKSSSEQSWIDFVPRAPPTEQLFTFQDHSPTPAERVIPTSYDMWAHSPQTNVVIPSAPQQCHNSSPSSSPSPSCEKPQPRPLLPRLNSDDIIPFDPSNSHPYDVELITQSQKLSLPYAVAESAKRTILKFESERGQSTRLSKQTASMLIRAALFLACRQIGLAKTFSEFQADLDRSATSQFHKQFRIIDIFNKQCPTPVTTAPEESSSSFPSLSVADFVRSEAASLGVDDRVRDRALAIAQNEIVQDLFAGRRPSLIAAVALSFAAECEEIFCGVAPYAEAAKSSAQTVSNAQKTLLKAVEEMARGGSLPQAFRARWNFPGYRLPSDGNYL